MTTGEAKGSLHFRSTGLMQPSEALKFRPDIRAQLEDIKNQGWKYLFIEVIGTVQGALELENTPFKISSFGSLRMGESIPLNVLQLTIGNRSPAIVGTPEVKEFRINICTKSFPRAATVDLAAGTVTYIHDPFWRWERGWENDKEKLSEAREVQEVAAWLLDVKKYKLIEPFKLERYQELSALFRELPA